MGHYLFQVTTHEIHELVSNQEETDSPVVHKGYKSPVVGMPDSDILFILLHFAHIISPTIFLDVGTGKHCQIVNVSELAELKGDNYCIMVLGLYVFTGEDVTSAVRLGQGEGWTTEEVTDLP